MGRGGGSGFPQLIPLRRYALYREHNGLTLACFSERALGSTPLHLKTTPLPNPAGFACKIQVDFFGSVNDWIEEDVRRSREEILVTRDRDDSGTDKVSNQRRNSSNSPINVYCEQLPTGEMRTRSGNQSDMRSGS